MKNRLIIAALLFFAATSFVMAGGGGADRSGRTTVRFFHRWPMEPRNSYFNQVIANFEKQNPDIRVEMEYVENETYKEKIRVLVSSNDIPDVFISWSDTFALNLVRSGRIRILNEMLAKDKAFAESFIQSQILPFTFDENVYGLPLTIDGKVFAYNKEIFNRAGITKIPETFSELISTLETLKRAGWDEPLIEGLSLAWTIGHYQGTIFQRIIPQDVLDRDYNKRCGVAVRMGIVKAPPHQM